MTQQLGALAFAGDSSFQHPLDSSQPPVTPVPGDLHLLPFKSTIQVSHTEIHAVRRVIYKIEINQSFLKKSQSLKWLIGSK